MNSFTSPEPSFAYESTEARRELGIPSVPEVHFAITDLAENLLPIAETSSADPNRQRIAALRTASGAVLFGWPLLLAERELRMNLDLAVEPGEHATHWITNDKDWLSEAVAQLREEGLVIRRDFQRQRTNYGWRELENDA